MTTNSSGSRQQQNPQKDSDRQDQNAGFKDQVQQTNKATQDQQATDNSPPKMQTGEQDVSRSGGNVLNMDNLPQDVKEALPEEAQHIFIAAYNSIMANSNDEQTAARIAWQTIETNEHYQRGDDGKWHRLPDNAGMHTPIHETSP